MGQYRLLPRVGSHVEDGVIYKASDEKVIESETELDVRFPNKFQKLEFAPTIAPTVQSEQKSSESVAVSENVNLTQETTVKTKQKQAETTIDETNADFGEDVTNAFPVAKLCDVRVFKDSAGKLRVTTKADEATALFGPIRDVKKVKDFLKQYMKDDNDSE